MKKKISLLLAILMLVTLIPTSFAEAKTVDAKKASQKLTLDGKEVNAGFYYIEGSNYIKLRDLAAIMNSSEKKFNVAFDEKSRSFIIERGRDYEKAKGDLEPIKEEKASAKLSYKDVLINYKGEGDGVYQKKMAKTALINGNNYLKLRDLAELAGFYIDFDEKTKTIELKTEYQDDPSYDGFLSRKFSEDDEKVFKEMEKLYLGLVDDDNKSASDAMTKLYGLERSEDMNVKYLNQMKDYIKQMNVKSLSKDYKLEKVIENYEDGTSHVASFNTKDYAITFMMFKANYASGFAELNFLITTGNDYSNGSLDDYYSNLSFNEGEKQGSLFYLHDSYIKKDYERFERCIKSLNIKSSKEEMLKLMDGYAKEGALKPQYTYTSTEKRFYKNSTYSYTFDYGTDKLFFMQVDSNALNTQIIPKDKTNN